MSEFQPLVSCIIPTYNAEKYLEQGIESLLAQTYKKLEIILVDDKSNDKTWQICLKYAEKYSNIYAIQNSKNSGGPLRGRERGIKEAHGSWITFMDCDDYVLPKYIEHLVMATNNGEYDIAVTGHSRLYPDGKIEDFLWNDYSQTTKERLKTFFKHYFLDQDFWTDPADTVGQNLVRASVAKKTDLSMYPNRVWGEDTLMALAFLANSKNGVNFVNYHDFVWRQRPGSGSHGGFSTTADRPGFYKACYEILRKNSILPIVSVIIPIFKVEQFLRDCLDSVIAQTYPGLEIILVDDKSPDDSGRIADEYANKDSRIQVVHKPKNEGLNMARASGFKASTGEYALFVDSDDLITEDCVESTLRVMLKNATDFVRFGMLTFKNKKDLKPKFASLPIEKELVLRNKKELYITQFNPGVILGDLPMLSMTVWGGIYKKKLVDKIDWAETNYRIYEDNVWMLRFLENASSGVYTSHIAYLYRVDESMTSGLSRRLTGNSFNGRPVGYMEFWNYIWNQYRHYNRRYGIEADDIIEDAIKHLYTFRANHLTEANLWGVENNAQYLPEAINIYQEKLNQIKTDVKVKSKTIKKLETENAQMKNDLISLQNELKSHLSISRSAKLMLGNIKRRIKPLKAHGFKNGK